MVQILLAELRIPFRTRRVQLHANGPMPTVRSSPVWHLAAAMICGCLVGNPGCSTTKPLEPPASEVITSSCDLPPETCETSNDCPMGTRCQALPPGVSNQSACQGYPDPAPEDTRVTKHCVLESATPSFAALIQGFDVPRFDIARGEGGTFRYEAPPGTSYVTCALFACEPELVGQTWLGTPRTWIQNFERCVIRYNNSSAANGTFDPSSDVYPSPRPRRHCEGQDLDRPYYAQLSVGCWAYGDQSMLAASSLLKLEEPATSNIGGNGESVGACGDQQDGADCIFVQGTLALGTCLAGQCLDRCVNDRDCELRATTVDRTGDAHAPDDGGAGAAGAAGAAGRSDPAPCLWRCEHAGSSATGGCKKLP